MLLGSLLGTPQLPARRGQLWRLGSAPREQGQEERERPQAGPGEAQGGHQQEFPHGNAGQALEGAALGGLECPSLKVSWMWHSVLGTGWDQVRLSDSGALSQCE